ncbi:MAG: acetyl-CoA C-acyltransferase [Deltaproteobacteria bacterium]|nr:acetyl-CoA C-acyltransferase [Deltaproteobacteria bacterium]
MQPSSVSLAPVYLVDAVRTPIGRYGGALAEVRPDDLAAHVVAALVARQPAVCAQLEQVVFGSTNQAGEDNRNVARMASLLAGLPYEVAGVTVNRLCGSGLEALADAARMIAVGEVDVALAGGVESMSRAPYVMSKPREAFSRTPPEIYDTSLGWRFQNPRMAERFELVSMGETAENVAEKHGISRADQDAFAAESHRRAAAAWERGAFTDEVVPVTVPAKKGAPTVVAKDECVRTDASVEKLATLRPVFRAGGTVTAGNSSPLNDGAAALLVMSERALDRTGATPLARIVASTTVGLEPNYMGEGPIPAVRKLLARTGLEAGAIDLVELNEAFAAQALACIRTLGFDAAQVNPNGGSIALGHPIGCSGARIVATLAHEMKRRGARRGVASLCIGVGQGIALMLEHTRL